MVHYRRQLLFRSLACSPVSIWIGSEGIQLRDLGEVRHSHVSLPILGPLFVGRRVATSLFYKLGHLLVSGLPVTLEVVDASQSLMSSSMTDFESTYVSVCSKLQFTAVHIHAPEIIQGLRIERARATVRATTQPQWIRAFERS